MRRTTRPPAQPRHDRILCFPLVSSVRTNHLLHSLFLSRLLSSRHLNDASHRETFESAHSTILAIFAAQLGSTTSTEDQGTGVGQPTFVEKIVPFYMQCLLEVRPTICFIFHLSLRKYNIYRTRSTESSPPHSCASRIPHSRAVRVEMRQRWATFAFPLSTHC